MNRLFVFANVKSFSSPPVRRPHGAFALVTTLLILSLLAIVAVSYLTSMSAERQTAEAYSAKAIAEQAAQTGVDNATAMLAECFRDFPDSATVWDTTQTINSGMPPTGTPTVSTTYNEGTSLYLRAVPSAQNSTSAYAVPLPSGVTYTNGGTSYAASNDSHGNDPNNPACQNFVLPLISGVPSGQARLVSQKNNIFQSVGGMNLNVSDPVQQNWTDLNVRTSTDDKQGVIGSPPSWTASGAVPVGPKPARAYWVKLKTADGLTTGRYAFWIEDESFRANNSLLGSTTQPQDNSTRPLDTATGKPRVALPGDLTLVGPLTAAGSQLASYASDVTMLRSNSYPGNFFPDPLAFSHAIDGTSVQGKQAINVLRYLTTNQSSTLNLSRHGSQRLNLNSTVITSAARTDIQKQVNQLVQTMEYHLPYLGERFYRTNTSALNDATQVSGSPYAGSYSSASDGSHSQIYYYKIAANLRDYVDTDSQPTMIGRNGAVMAGTMPNAPLVESGPNDIWAQGKECTPYIQEVAVRYRPVVTYTIGAASGRYTMNVDYYIEFWNMSDHDIDASQMNSPSVWVRDQQEWDTYHVGDQIMADPTPVGAVFTNNSMIPDTQLDLLNGVMVGTSTGAAVAAPRGVVFRAGAVTVVTSDPQFASYKYTELLANGKSGSSGGKTNNPAYTNASGGSLPNLSNVYVCPVIAGSNLYAGAIVVQDKTKAKPSTVGLQMGGPFENASPNTGTEVSLVNSQGYFDVVRGAITKTGATGYNIYTVATAPNTGQGGYQDFSYGSSMMGNSQDTAGGPNPGSEAPTVSQLGDPRTTNEQLSVNDAAGTTADGTRFMASTRTLGWRNYPDLIPEGRKTPAAYPWLDYYAFPPSTGTGTNINYPSPDYTTAPTVVAGATVGDTSLTSIGQLGDLFDPARVPNPAVLPATTSILSSHGGGRTLKVGQHDDLYSDDPQTNAYPSDVTSGVTSDYVSASTGWASWRLADIFDVADPIQLPGRININGVMRDDGAAFLSALQGFVFQSMTTSGASDAVIHGDLKLNPGTPPTSTPLNTATGSTSGYSQIIAQMKQRLDAVALSNGAPSRPVKPFFERGELGELGYSTAYPANNNPLFSAGVALAGVEMSTVTDHSREELFRRLAQMICTKGNTFTVYAVGQSILQTTAAGPMKITGTQRLRVTFRLVPKSQDTIASTATDFHPAYLINTDGTLTQNTFDPANTTAQPAQNQAGAIGVIPRFAKPDRYDVQILQVAPY